MVLSEKFVRKYMRMAKQVGEDENPCYSRKIGVVIVRLHVDEEGREWGKVLGTGYNGPPRHTPHCDNPGYLETVVWPQLTTEEKDHANGSLGLGMGLEKAFDADLCRAFCDRYGNTKTCPRKAVGAASGKRLELCSCAHGETNAIVNAADDLYGTEMFCWCPVPCVECTKLIINAGIKRVYCVTAEQDYSHGSRWLFAQAGVEVIENNPEYYLQ